MRTALDIIIRARPKGMSCEQIADVLTESGSRCSRQAVENWLSGRRGLSLAWFGRLAKIFAVPADEVARGRDALIAELEDDATAVA